MESRAVLRNNFSRGEAIGGIVWLSIGALFSVVMEVVYLGTRIDIPGVGSVAFPWPLLAALLFNAVLTKTARLWSDQVLVALIPGAVWLIGFFGFIIIPELSGDQLLGNNMRTILLLMAGTLGSVWPLLRNK